MKYLKIFYYVVVVLMSLGALVNIADGVFDIYQAVAIAGYIVGIILIEEK